MFPSQPRHCRGRAAAAVVVEVVADVVAVDVTTVEAAVGAEVATAVESLDVERVVVATHIIGTAHPTSMRRRARHPSVGAGPLTRSPDDS